MTLDEYCKLKDCTLLDIINHAKSKGIELPENHAYILSESDLKRIDPILYFSLKYKTTGRKSLNSSKISDDDAYKNKEMVINDSEANIEDLVSVSDPNKNNIFRLHVPPTYPELKVIGKIDLSVINQSTHINEKSKSENHIISDIGENTKVEVKVKENRSNRKLGFVKFFDSYKGFGYIITNKYISKNGLCEIDSIYVNTSNISGASVLRENQWVSFEKKKGKRGVYADNVKISAYDEEDLLLSIKYTGVKAYIKGRDRKGDMYDIHIFCKIASEFLKKQSADKLFEVISSHFSKIENLEKRSKAIHNFVLDSQSRNLLLRLPIHRLDETGKNIVIAALELESSEKKENIDWCLIDKWHPTIGLPETLSELLSNAYRKDDIAIRLAELSESFLCDLLSRIEKRHIPIENLKSIYFNHPDRLSLFISIDTVNPVEKGLLYLINDSELGLTDSAIFQTLLDDEDLVAPFLNKYYSEDRVNDPLTLKLNSDDNERIVAHISEKNVQNLPHQLRHEYFLINHRYLDAGRLALEHIEHRIILVDPILYLFSHLSEDDNRKKEQILEYISPLKLEQIKELMSEIALSSIDNAFVDTVMDKYKTPILGNIDNLPINYYCKSYLFSSGDISFLSRLTLDDYNQWLNQSLSEDCGMFLMLYLNNSGENGYLEKIDLNLIAKSIRGIEEESARLEMVNKLPLKMAKELISHHFKESSLYAQFLSEQWEKLKLQVPHLTFDIESDGKMISEFAFKSEENSRSYVGERQIGSMMRRINGASIVVGHNIKEWDLPILEKFGLDIKGFIWDTLEIELLLNPCRYAYALKTAHNAKNDVELIDSLFWNQLLRLSRNEKLCDELKSLLPTEINAYIQLLQDPFFEDIFKTEAKADYQFFQELIPLSKSVISKLKEVNSASEKDDILIIAPKDIWPRLAQYMSLKFPTESSIDYYSINPAEISNENGILNKILIRFCDKAATPIVVNIPQYLRTGEGKHKLYISNDTLENIAQTSNGRIDCIDFESFDSIEKLKKQYSRIVTIGGELHDRIHRIQIGESYDSISPNIILSKLFLSLAACNYALVPVTDYKHFGIKKDDLAASIWAERDTAGRITIFKNLKFKAAKKRFLSHFNASIENIDWKLENQNKGGITPSIVTVRNSSRDSSRLSESTTFRAQYWACQFGIIKELNPQQPIVYVINDSNEIDTVSSLAKELGYYVPEHGSSFRKLEHIESHPNGLVVISKKQFLDGIGEYRTNQPYCYIWDSMDIDRLRLMWDVLPFEDDEMTDESNEADSKSGKTTTRKCIVAAWPIMRHYSSLIKANSRDSQMIIIDANFDENPDVADICNCGQIQLKLTDKSVKFAEIAAKSKLIFKNTEFSMPELNTDSAMEAIKHSFIPGHEWYDYQKEIIPDVLDREHDLLISLPTGGGKSVIFQGPAIYRAATSHGLSIIISPLRALMQDQVEELAQKGFGSTVDYISGDRTYPEVQEIYRRIRGGEISLLYITPERFRVKSFMRALNARLEHDKGLEYIIFDEAHCISQWGQEFRPDYRNAILECTKLKERFDIKLCLLSATVTAQIENDIRVFIPDIKRLGQSVEEYNPIRSHIDISFKFTDHEDERRIDEICNYIINNCIDFSKSRMIIFCRTHRQCEDVCENLSQRFKNNDLQSFNVISEHIGFFHAGMDSDQRNETYRRFKASADNEDDKLYILCATKAFGMGMDIPNIHYVLHFSPPSVMEDYLQEVGRAGRNEEMYKVAFADGTQIPAQCLVSMEDFRKLKELLLKSLISWSNIEMVRQKIAQYILRFRNVEEACASRIVVPFNIWTKDDSPERFNDTTASRIAFHWLEHIGLIRLGYLDQACMDITLNKAWNPIGISCNNRIKTELGNALIDFCKTIGEPSLLSIRDMRERIGRSWPTIVDVLLQAQQRSILSINDTIRCVIKPRRHSETEYMVSMNKNVFALHIIINGMKTVLSKLKAGKSKIFDTDDLRQIVDGLTSDVEFMTIDENGVENERGAYMPWRTISENSSPRMDVKKVDTFKKDIIQRTGPKLFWLLNYIPGVTSAKKRSDEGYLSYTVTLTNEYWQQYIEDWEADLFNILKYIKNHDTAFSWAEMMLQLCMFIPGKKGFSYLDNSLSLLKSLQYIDFTPLVKSGIEVQSTENAFVPLEDGTDETSRFYDKRQEFDEEEKMKKIRISAMDIFSKLGRDKQSEFIRKYFQNRNYNEFLELAGNYCPEEYPEILDALSEEALGKEEGKLKGNPAQLAIYNNPITEHINVLAGPGSGKTHVLTLRCAKLVYKEHVDPSHILVLAYNRAVVVELKNRLNKLFTRLGLSRMAHQMHVYTFHALAKIIMGNILDNVPTEQWEQLLYKYIIENRSKFLAKFPDIDFVFIDEFQDITEPRLNTIEKIHEYHPDAKFFTIGDINQSIYGFDRVSGFNGNPKEYSQRLNPQPYYARLQKMLKPKEMSMFTNYRSYQEILDKAADFIPAESELPKSAPALMSHAPLEACVVEFIDKKWFSEIPNIIDDVISENQSGDPYRRIDTIAIFFRTNNEVYRGFSQLKKLNLDPRIRVRIQGTSSYELWRQREVYHILSYFRQNSYIKIVLKNNKTRNLIKDLIKKVIQENPNWDSYYLDVTFTLCLHYLESIRCDERTHTYGELAEFIKDLAGNDDGGQVFKIYDEYQNERILSEKPLTIVLTTMHKVKGLEFDIVVVTPSFANLPLCPHRPYNPGQPLLADDLADIEEERRLRFVAYTRAKKKLFIFNSDREKALIDKTIYLAPESLQAKLGITEREPGLDKYNLGYHSNYYPAFKTMDNLRNIKPNSPVLIRKTNKIGGNISWTAYEIVDCETENVLGELSKRSSIRRQMEAKNLEMLSGFFVSDIIAWEYKDSERYDKKNATDYSTRWIPQSQNQGFVYIVQIAGFGKQQTK